MKAQATIAFTVIQKDQTEHLLSEKQLALLHGARARSELAFSQKDAVKALGFPPRTIEASINKLREMKKLERLGQGRATRCRLPT